MSNDGGATTVTYDGSMPRTIYTDDEVSQLVQQAVAPYRQTLAGLSAERDAAREVLDGIVDAWNGEDGQGCSHAEAYYALEALARSGKLSAVVSGPVSQAPVPEGQTDG